VLELLGVAVLRRVPDLVEDRADDLRLDVYKRAVQPVSTILRRVRAGRSCECSTCRAS
jgi:hypothetical protein